MRQPAGGTCAWVELPPGCDTRGLAAEAAARGLAYAPGESFRFDGDGPPALLLSFGALAPDAIRDGVAELASLLRARLRPPGGR